MAGPRSNGSANPNMIGAGERPERRSRAAFLRCFPWLVLLAWPVASEGSRDHRPMGYYIKRADLIVIADAGKPEWDGNPADFAWEIHRMPVRVPITVRKVLKGDGGLAGQEIVLRHEQSAFLGSKGFAYIAPDARGIAVLLEPGWRGARAWPVLEAYHTPEEIAALRTLVGICALGRESDRLIQLRALHAAGNPSFREEFVAQLRDMRDPANFHFLTDLYPTLDPKDQFEWIEIIGWIGDLRGVPTLLEAVNSPDPKVSQAAVYQLTAYYPGAPGIIETFEKNLGREHLTRAIAGYLARHRPTPEVKTLAEGPETAWHRASKLLEAGKTDEGQAVYLDILKDDREPYRMRVLAATKLIERPAGTSMDPIRAAFLSLLASEDDATARDGYHRAAVARILRSLSHPDCLPALLRILGTTGDFHAEAAYVATMAVREIGEGARREAFAHILGMLKAAPAQMPVGESRLRYPLELLWLGEARAVAGAEPLMRARCGDAWEALRPLTGISRGEDEGLILQGRLEQRQSMPNEGLGWVLMRLRDLKDRRVIRELAASLRDERHRADPHLFVVDLVTIGGPQVEEELMSLLTDKSPSTRSMAAETLFLIQGDRSRELARRILSEENVGDRMRAYHAMGRLGTAEDLDLLLPLADFWTGDRENHHWAMSAVASIRRRCGLDVTYIGQGSEVDLTLELEKPAYVLGEAIRFWIGVSAKAGKTIPEGFRKTGYLHTTRPDGTTKTERIPWPIDGCPERGWRGGWGFGREGVQAGTYTLVLEFAGKRTEPVGLTVRELDVMKKISARFSFLKKGAVKMDEAIPVVFEVENGTPHLLRFPELGAQFTDISMRVTRETPPEGADFFYPHEKLPGAKVTLSMDGPAWAWLGRIPFVALKPGEEYEFHLSVEDAYRFPGAGKYNVEFMTVIPLLLGEADGEFAEVGAIRLPVESAETFTVTGAGEQNSGQTGSSETPCESSER